MAVHKWEILSDGTQTGVREWMRYDPVAQEMEVRSEQVTDPVLEANKAQYNATDERARWGDSHTHVASIPFAVIEAYKRKGIDLMKDEAALRRFLNDPDNRLFRTRPGRV